MIIKTIHITVGVLVAFSVLCVAVMVATFVAVIAFHVMVVGGFTVYHLMNS